MTRTFLEGAILSHHACGVYNRILW